MTQRSGERVMVSAVMLLRPAVLPSVGSAKGVTQKQQGYPETYKSVSSSARHERPVESDSPDRKEATRKVEDV